MTKITIPQLIERARQAGFDFGNWSPVNLIHYYSRLGLIPKAERLRPKGVVGHTVGCYDESVVGRLLDIQEKFRSGLTAYQIKLEIESPVAEVTSGKRIAVPILVSQLD